MITTTGAALQIDTVHARAICDEIGERLRTMLRVQISREPPPRLKELMQQLAGLDEELAPSIVPSLEDMKTLEGPVGLVPSEGIAARTLERVAISSR
jgi:hypothetical protein